MKFLVVLTLSFIVMTKSHAEAIPGLELLNNFRASCKGQGEWTKAALGDAEALMQTIRSISNDEDCKTVGGAIASLNNLANKLNYLNEVNENQTRLAGLKAQEQELLLQISNTSDPSLLYTLQTSLSSVQMDQSYLVATTNYQNKTNNPRLNEMLVQMINASNSMFQQVSKNQTCLTKHPSVLSSSVSLLSSVGATAMNINPVLGLGLAAGTDFIGNMVEFARKNKLNRSIRKISDGTVAFEAYRCVLETLSSRLCQMDDAELLVEKKAKFRNMPISSAGLYSAIRMFDREVPVLLNWLNSIRAGVSASNIADADRLKKVFEREAAVRTAQAIGSGILTEKKKLYDSFTDPVDRWNVIRETIKLLVPTEYSYNGVASAAPLLDIYPSGLAPFYLLGLNAIPTYPGNGAPISFSDFNPFIQWPSGTYTPDYNLLKVLYDQWVEKARNRVNQELNLLLQPDPLKTITSAYDKSESHYKISPKDALLNIKIFLKQFDVNKTDFKIYRQLFEDTIKKITIIDALIDEAITKGFETSDPRRTIQEIYNTAELQYGTIVLQNRLEMSIRLALMDIFLNSAPTDQQFSSQLLAADHFVDVLGKISGTDNLSIILADIKRAQPYTLNTLQGFMDLFANNVEDSLKDTLKKEQQSRDPKIKGLYRRQRTELCFGILAVPTWPSSIPKEYCENLSLEPVIPGGPASSVIDKNMFEAPMSKRACIFRDYARKSKIYQDWNIQF